MTYHEAAGLGDGDEVFLASLSFDCDEVTATVLGRKFLSLADVPGADPADAAVVITDGEPGGRDPDECEIVTPGEIHRTRFDAVADLQARLRAHQEQCAGLAHSLRADFVKELRRRPAGSPA